MELFAKANEAQLQQLRDLYAQGRIVLSVIKGMRYPQR